ncbi:MAG TPA: DUF2520 domain-containing protein [Hungateiclostridium thermocellum]|uniref:DUF2520 domain-containing protein n=1 Tax=Acetivibrio thermocellus (strain ATCC 27405 / DSM 1237 / JCM 9322 / NBRC 103400 / NCIMB 10682 / NRRL B-4536 / VPI 7372) TaxID=203119 RepID=A3DCC6_ACET2|nr:Rossmann-like and DUF2520 domain-containing protein [Acetivibrio thermocellus]CDG35044.1 NADP oxidoreductase, coenzyme F420-dependent [Acetivibrio thermocellus BC1]ABN51605.1 Domain of unknown function DUF2520 [Acetivibrio thermocellus ATCC 27405]THJ76851.1 DUF2520 domain-containing protein [Acetivibrio thermocellus]UWV45866.1 F420-dependent NADP oxidoreductase [Acetivibrio thermocellus]HBW26107.1 DUF2520 domain-containing protein [Acetivibrio thermocellus]
MNIGIIGAGKVGCALAEGLKNNGFNISGVYSRSVGSQKYLCEKLGKIFENDLEDAVKNSDVIFISVSDNNIIEVAEEIVRKVDNDALRSKTFIHMSGALTAKALKPLENLGAYTGSLHPIQSVADKDSGWKKLYNIYYGFEGCEEALKHALTVVKSFEGKLIKIKEQDKTLYHAAACIISNYTVTLSYVAYKILESIGFDRETADKAFLPLIKNTVHNIERLGSIDALTGPVSRGDNSVVEQHVKSLRALDKELEKMYKVIGRMTVEVAQKKGTLNDDAFQKLMKILEL